MSGLEVFAAISAFLWATIAYFSARLKQAVGIRVICFALSAWALFLWLSTSKGLT